MYTNEYWRSFMNEKPQKQAKSYEIDLGQNVSRILFNYLIFKNGPYKEELLLRYGDHTINKMLNKQGNKNNLNMDEIMKMNEDLKPFQERVKKFNPNNFITQCGSIESKIMKLEKLALELKDKENKINATIETMTNEVFKTFDEIYNEFNPQLITKYKYLKSNIREQKDENANLHKQIDLLKQDLKTTTENIDKLKERLMALESITGFDQNDDVEDGSKILTDTMEKVINPH